MNSLQKLADQELDRYKYLQMPEIKKGDLLTIDFTSVHRKDKPIGIVRKVTQEKDGLFVEIETLIPKNKFQKMWDRACSWIFNL
jgi:cell shape-determining protein MreC